MKKLLLLLTTITALTIHADVLPFINPVSLTLQDFSLGKDLNYTRPDADSGYDNEEYFYNIASFTVDTAGSYNVVNTVFNANYVGVDRTFENETDLLDNGTPAWMADTMIYVYDEPFSPSTPRNPLFFADNDDNQNYEGTDEWGDLLFNLTASLDTNTTYYGVITTYDPKVAGDGWMTISGPGAVTLNMGVIPESSSYALILGWIAFLYLAISSRQKSRKL